jgi:ADP-ribosylglycohydrolase
VTFPSDYAERVYAGVLGKIIGVYLGRPFEGWTHERIMANLGEIKYYVNDRHDLPLWNRQLVVTDDDISGTFTFLRALPDYNNTLDLTPAQIGQTWLNYIIENRTILWWGGRGNSTEHTAFLRLRDGIPAPNSGSIALNSKTVAEQIGAQIFIDGWGLIAPGEPALAVDLARRAASVSHDGEAIYGAQVIAALIAQAFIEADLDKLIDIAVAFIPTDSIIYRLIADIRSWHAADPEDWYAARAKLAAKYGYDKYGGNCHIVPNHGLVILSLLYSQGDFHRAQTIVNTCGWDTDCNAGNIGCVLGVRNGLAAFEKGPDWRGPVADRLYLSTADGGRAISDALRETYHILEIAHALRDEKWIPPKAGARFHFSLPGSVQGFHPQDNLKI